MKRHAILISLLALAVVPDWASAFGLRRCGLGLGLGRGSGFGLFNRGRGLMTYPIVCPPPVVYSPPVYYYTPPVVVPCPTPGYTQPRPMISEPEKPKAAVAPKVDTIPSPPAAPFVPSTPKQPEIKPADLQRPETPPPATPKLPMPGIPEKKSSEPSAGILLPEAEPMPLPSRPPVGPLPTIPAPTTPPEAKKAEDPGPKLPTLTPNNPGSSNIPPLSIPGVGEAERIAKSSPLASPPPVNIYWVEGDVPASPRALRKVNFFNQTEADVQLTVEGRTTRLPKKHFIEVEVPSTFRWRYADYPEQTTEMPLAAPGAEIVLRRPKL